MYVQKRLKPVIGCWVLHEKFGRGLVRQVLDNIDGVTLKVGWQNREYGQTLVSASSVASGFMVGMEVQHVPVSKVELCLKEGIVLKVKEIAGFHQVLVKFSESSITRWLPFERLSWIKGVEHRFCTNDFGDVTTPMKFKLKVLAHAIENWNENTGSLSRLDIDPLPHQVHLVHHILASGHLNWMIADDVGLGKTIETGMLLKALEQRGQADRVLLVTPAGLTSQWKEELHNKFGLSEFRIYGENFNIDEAREWGMYKHVIGSIDRFKEDNHLEKLLRAEPWDLVIFDEAHRLSRRQYGMKYDASNRFQLANFLRAKTKAMVLLTATPHQGKPDKFQSLLMLLNPDRKDEIETLALNPEILSEMIIRNNKSDVTDLEGNFIFKGKTTKAIRVTHDKALKDFDCSLQSYLRKGYQTASEMGQAGNAIGFVMTVYRKLAASSAKAINQALHNRKLRLLEESQSANVDDELLVQDERYSGEAEEQHLKTTQGKEFFDGELEQLDILIAESEQVLITDPKLKEFKEVLIPSILANNKSEKVLIFTEYRSTQEYLKTALEEYYGDGCVNLINGSMKHQVRREAIRNFEDVGQFLISTEAGGEGINLQDKCHIMINYDLPWNPMRLVQRIGRLYRYGQKHRVVVFNLYSPESMDDQIMELMHERIEQVVGDLASLSGEYNERLSDDILGEVADLVDVGDILLEATSDGIVRTRERIEEALEKAKNSASKQRELFEYAAGFDPKEAKEELNITSEHVMYFMQGMFDLLNIEVVGKTHKDLIWQIKLNDAVATDLGVRRTKWQITFDRALHASRENCEMMDLDNFLFKYLLKKAKSYEFGGLTASIGKASQLEGAVICSYLRWQNSLGLRQRQELVAIQVCQDKEVALNTQDFCNWLKNDDISYYESSRRDLKELFQVAQVKSEEVLKAKSNQLLHPESIDPIAAALFHT
ncbi:DEAD/DEAH box helicase [Vibrio navarrensis]|uniref:Helicase n=1 Tax=Vibrio navarrensis TaxID=29495 RepID=A0A099LTN4_9VIBR|nr:helicase-related protein [Vibrio navarrensis]EGR1138481.1 DEAD/DEAH box helicase [Vibrio cholerae]MBY7929374.1 DEAD/DEAH box helicase [Vibrio fluvialis]EGR1141123.1 DEAD/DEAH box helicase [Vibrio cholerae]EGR2514149.1 DEAD/DEAH box helicase [Vibrio cholerae]EGR2516789.1 DEAD/DEAH box helicase [Vibrio cholerae]